jgi:DNA-binding CsgD family transcriptional regulator
MLFERADQESGLRALYTRCLNESGKVAVVSGPVGSGKTELLHGFASYVVDAGAIYLGAAASRAERAVPFGVLGQLLNGVEWHGAAEHASNLRARLATLVEDEPGPDEFEGELSHHLLGVCKSFLGLVRSAPGPLVVGFDDLHHADEPSLQVILFVIRRIRSTRTMVVLTEAVSAQPAHPHFHAELPHEPHSLRFQIEPLSPAGVESMLGHHLDPPVARTIAAEAHAVTGGLPLLVRALVADFEPPEAGQSPRVRLGEAFARALSCLLCRLEPSVVAGATGRAVLGEACTPARLGELVGLRTDAAVRAIDVLATTGLLTADGFRHPSISRAVLAGMKPRERADLHLRAARLLHQDGAAPRSVARQLLAGEVADHAMVDVLHEAARQELAEEDVQFAARWLRLARRHAVDERQRAVTDALLIRTEWRFDPARSARYLHGLVGAVRSGILTGRDALVVVGPLLWFGYVAEAVDVLAHVSRSAAMAEPETATHVHTFGQWVAGLYPDATPGPQIDEEVVEGRFPAGHGDEPVAQAERILKTCQLGEDTVAPIVAALAVLVTSSPVDRLEPWCAQLIDDVGVYGAPAWRALLTAVRAEVALRRGDLVAAETYAKMAMADLPAASWGVAVGIPLSVLVDAAVAGGRFDEAVARLRTPVPDVMFQTPIGLYYLLARGRFRRAAGDLRSALHDFETVGALLARWRMDLPGLAGWHTEAVRCRARLGLIDRVGPPVSEQAGQGETAASGRVPAAIDVLPRRDDRVEPAGRLELGRARRPLGTSLTCAGRVGDLSEAEHRVAVLAAKGYRNRQIASKLYLTVSTVEQHLTRVYRKLNLTGRTDLATEMSASLSRSG